MTNNNNNREVTYERATETAKKIRKELKKHFPSIKFSIRSSTFSGGDSVDISWTDGATEKEVNERVLSKFQSGHFDGMQDMYISGCYTYEGNLYNGAKYVMGSRHTSQEYDSMVENYLKSKYPLDYEEIKADWQRHNRLIRNSEQEIISLHEEVLQMNNSNSEETPAPEESNIINQFSTIEKTIHTKKNIDIWVCKLENKLSKEEFKEFLEEIKNLGGYYSRFVKGFVFEFDPMTLVNEVEIIEESETVTEQETEHQEIYNNEEIVAAEEVEEIKTITDIEVIAPTQNNIVYLDNNKFNQVEEAKKTKKDMEITEVAKAMQEIEFVLWSIKVDNQLKPEEVEEAHKKAQKIIEKYLLPMNVLNY